MAEDRVLTERLSRRRLLKGVAVVAGGAVGGAALAACSPTTSAPVATSAGQPSAAAGPRKGGSLIIASGDALVPDLSVGNAFGPQGFTLLQWAWPLFRTKPASYEIINALAQSYTPSVDRLSHKISLRPGLKFHDGSPLDAAAVVANLKAALYQNDPLRGSGSYQAVTTVFGGFPGIVTSVEVNDPLTLTITLNKPYADLRGPISFAGIVNPKVMAASPKGYGTDVSLLKNAGSGPFRIVDFQPGQFVEFARFEGFFEEAYVDRLRIQLISDASARYLALKGGQANVAFGLSRADYEAASKDPAFRTHVSNAGSNVFMAFNATKNELLRTNKDVRQAIAMAMNRQAYVDSFYPKGLARLGTQVALAPGTGGYNPDVKALPYDPEGAKALLKKAGVTELSLSMIDPPAFGGASELKAQGEAIVADLGKVGIKVDFKLTDIAGYLAGSKDHDINVTNYGNSSIEIGVVSLYFRRPATTYQTPPDPRYGQLIGEAETALDLATQGAKLKQLMQIASDNVVGVPIAYLSVGAVSTTKIHDLSVTASPLDPQHRAWIEA